MSDEQQSDNSSRPKIIPAKRYFTIGEVSEVCAVKPHVLRYWEQEFEQLRPVKRRGNRRYYQHTEVLLIRRIRELLYERGLTITGARNQLGGFKADDSSGIDVPTESRQHMIERIVGDVKTQPHRNPEIPPKRYFTIGEVSELCAVKPHVLRYWEQEFDQLRPVKRRGNRRYYQRHEVLLIQQIRELLYEQGLTISGVRNEFYQRSLEPNALSYPLHVEVIGVGQTLSEYLLKEPSLVHRLSAEQFEEFVCERLYAMGFEPRQVGATNRKDGGVDVVFWPRLNSAFPFLGAAQIKHHANPSVKEGPATVREFAGVMAGHPFHAGLIVTNTTFSPDAEWFAREHASLMKLRGLNDIRRWLLLARDEN